MPPNYCKWGWENRRKTRERLEIRRVSICICFFLRKSWGWIEQHLLCCCKCHWDVGVAAGVGENFSTLAFACNCNFETAGGVIKGVAGRL